ncbi:MAG: NAD(P)-dependent oxidoreductase [Gemmataceae bacterium]|nr:NAD(P)-dependent oxidoreductase [Gemmataceae bacterium]
MKVAVLGSAGQLGRDLVPRLPGEVVPLTRADLDLARPETIAPAVADLRPAVLVNCAAYNFVDKAEAAPAAAFAVNAWGVRELARACHAAGTKLVQISTDYVFGLDARGATPQLGGTDLPVCADPAQTGRSVPPNPGSARPLTEDDPPGPVGVYGLSKLAGEYLVLTESPDNLVVRTCGLYGVWGSGGKGGNFVETMLRVAGQGKPLRVVHDQRCTPTYTADLADAVAGLVRAGATGLYHVTSGGDCTWYEFAAEIFRRSGASADLTPITTAEFGAAARRPAYSVLSNAKLAAAGVPAPRPWPEALAAYLAERAQKPG